MFPFRDEALWVSNSEDLSIYGTADPSKQTKTKIQCSIISVLLTPQLTSTGQDVSASRGRAGQMVVVAKIIVPLSLAVKRKDILVIEPADETGMHLEIQSVLTKNNVVGVPAFKELRLIHTDN